MLFNENFSNSFKSVFESLEDRVLFDGVPDATFVLPQGDVDQPVPAQVQDAQPADISGPRELILVDAGVADSDQLLAEVLNLSSDSVFEIRFLDSDLDGVDQISELLSSAEGQYSAIHIISHGDEGEVQLGNSTLSNLNLNQYKEQLADWASALTADGDLLFYGCDLAGNAEGQQFIESISVLTGADVAASDDLTGAADKGGDWDLELSVGTVEAQSLRAENWDGTLADKDGDGVDDADDLDDDNDGILDSEEGFSVTTETVDLSGYEDGALTQTFSVHPDVDVRLSITSANGSFFPLGGIQAPFFDPQATGFAGNIDDVGIVFDPPNGAPSPITVNVEFFEAGTTNPFTIAGMSTEISDIDASDPLNPTTGRRDRVTVTASEGGTDQPVALSLVDPANATLAVSGNVGTALNDPAAASANDDNGSVTVSTGAIDSFTIVYDEITMSIDPVPRGIGILGNFTVEVPVSRDTDGDGVADHCDLDSDNDGISDLEESGADASVVDLDGDGVYDNTTGPSAQVDSNGVPIAANGGVSPIDTDMDGIDDYLDLDSDNDGIPDTIEAFPTAGYTTNDGNVTDDDTDGDGILDVFDSSPGHGGDFTTPEDTDGDNTPDFLDTDSDNDGMDDATESGLTPGPDNNGDGIADNVAPNSYQDPDGVVNNPSSDLDNETGNTSEVGYREVVADLVTVKTLVSGDPTPDEGDTVTFQIQVTNNGGGDATNVTLTDQLPAGLTFTSSNASEGTFNPATGLWTIGGLNAGSTATITISATVDAGQGGNLITNVTTAANADQDDPSTAGDDLTEQVSVNDDAELVTVKTLASGDATPAEGDTVTFQIEVTNRGAAQATNVTLTDQLPAGLTYTTSSGGAYNPTTGLWTIGILNSGDTATLTISGTVNAGQGGNTITNTTSAASGDQNDPSTAGDDLTESVEIEDDADLVTVKTLASGDSTPAEGDTVSFDIEVTNNGTAQATNVSLTDSLPAGLTLVSSSVTQGSYDSATGLYTIGTLNAGSSATLTLVGTVDIGEGGNTITNVTTAATGDQPDPSTAGDDLTEAVVIEEDADLVTVKTLASGDSTPAEGDTVSFDIEVTNNGTAQATNVSLTDSLPAGLTFVSSSVTQGSYDSATGLYTIGTLNAGSSATLTLVGTVDIGEGGNTITNVTTAATGDQPDPSTAGDDLTEAVVIEEDADLVTVKTLASGDSTPAEGDTVSFDIEVTNNGTAQATNVSLTDSLPAGLTFVSSSVTQGSYDSATGLYTIGTLNAGSSATLTLVGTVDIGEGGNTITNVTTAAVGDQPDPGTAGDDLTEAVLVDADANLVTVKTLASGDTNPAEGDTVSFDIEVTNNGTAQATNVSLIDTLPSGLTFVSSSVTQGSYNATTGLYTIGTLNAGSSATLTLTGTINAEQGGNTLTNITTAASGDQPDPSTAGDDLTESVVVAADANLITVKTLASGDSTPAEGDTVSFDIEVTNNGTAQATNVSLTDTLPAGLTFVSSSVTQGSYNATTGLYTIGTIAAGGSATLTLVGTVDVGEGGNTLTNITTAAIGDQPDPSTAGDDLTESVEIEDDADLVTVKTLASGDSTPAEGDTVSFDIEVTNNGTAQATNVSLTDSLPAGLTFVSSSVTQGSYDSATGLYTVGTLNAGSSATLTLVGTVDIGEGGNTITNVTTAATGDQPDPSTAGDDLTEAVVIEDDADLVTVKTLASGDSTPAEGDTVSFDIEVTNNGTAQATNVSLTDSLPAGLTFVSSSVTQGSYDSATGLYTIGTLNAGSSATLTLVGTVDIGEGGNTITNVTTAATGDQPDPSTAGDDLTEAVVIEDDADLVTVKTLASGDSTPAEGDTVSFDIEVTNNGTAQATNVSLTDSLPAGLTFVSSSVTQGSYDSATGLYTIGTLNAGSSATLTLVGTVDIGEGGNTITNVTTAASGDQPDPGTAGDDLTEAVLVDADANLVTVKTLASGDSTPDEGDTVSFDIQVTNNGTAQATNVSLTDTLPAGLTFVSSSVTQGSYNSATGLFTIGTLDAGSTATVTLVGTVDVGQGGNTITNVTTAATGDQPDPSAAGDDLEEAVVVNDAADLVTVKTLASGDATPAEGDTVTFQIEITNNGAAQATNVSLVDQLPAGITFSGSTVSQGIYDATTGMWTIGTLADGGTATIMLSGTVDVGAGGQTITNITTAASGDQPDPSTAGDDLEEAVVVENEANLVTVKTLVSGDSTPAIGDTVTFQIEVTNNGAAQATNVSLTDQLPTGLTYVSDTAAGGAYDPATGLWTIGTLNSGDTATITISATVDASQAGMMITNVTTAATGDQSDPSTVGDDLEEAVNVDEQANLVTVKTLASSDSTPAEGDTVTFDITVTNDGPNDATNVSLTDLLPAGLTATAANGGITQGSYDSATGLWTIGSLANGATATLTLEGTVDVGSGGATITNVTTAAMGDQPDPSTVGDDLTESVGSVNDADLVTVKTLVSGDDTPAEGDTVVFQILVTNNGAAQATNVSLTDSLPAGLTYTADSSVGGAYDPATGIWTIGTLASGATATLTIEGTVDVGEGGNTITNITTAATGDQPDPSTAGDDLEEAVIVDDAADLVTVKTLISGDSTPAVGDTVTFQIVVVNNGSAQATNVSLTDSLPTGITYSANTTSQGAYDSATGIWMIGTLEDGEAATLTLSGTVDASQAGMTVTNVTTAATGDQPDPSSVGDDLDEAVDVDPVTNLITVKTLASGTSTPAEGDTVTFDITVTNDGPNDATNVTLTDLLPAGLTATTGNGGITQGSYDSVSGLWTIGSLANGANATLTLEGTVNAGSGGVTITNVTTAAEGDQDDPTTVGDDLTESVGSVNDADLVTVKTLASGDDTPDEGDTVIFEILVTNNGAAQATNVSLTDTLPSGITYTANTTSQGSYDPATGLWTIGTLANGGTATITLSGTVDVGEGGNTITNITTAATGDQPDPSTVGDDLEEPITVNDAADLVTVKTLISGDATPAEGDTVTFQIEVTNNGGAQATNVSLIDSIPAGFTLAGNTTTQGTYAGGTWTIGTLNVGETATITLTGTIDVGQAGNTITNVTTAATGDQTDPTNVGDDLDESVIVEDNTTDLVTVKTLASGDSTPDEGDTVVFQIDVTNNGGAQATNVALTDNLPAGFTLTSNSVTQGTYVGGTWTIGTLDVGDTATITLTGTIDAGQSGNTITNVTTAATGDQTDPSTAGDDLEEAVVVGVPAADLVTVKTLASGDATPDEGDTVIFQIEVTNNGPDAATNVSLTDSLPAGLTYTTDSSVGGAYDSATGLWTIGTLASGATATLTIEGTVDVGEGGNMITNITTAATGDQPDPTNAGDDLEEAITVNDAADLVTVKTLASSDSTPEEGDTVVFQIDVTNNGGAQATNVSLTDSLPAGITYSANTTTQGSYDSATGLWTIGTLNDGASATITLIGTVDIGTGGNMITNITTAATGDQTDPSTAGDDLEEAVVVDNTTDLVTVKTLASGDSTPDEGDTVTFQIEVTNNGGAQATNVSLTDNLPAGFTLTTNSVTQGTYVGGTWTIGTLNDGDTATLTLTGTVDAGQAGNTITNVVTAATGDQPDPTTAGDDLDESIAVGVPAADLVTVKTLASGDSTPNEGDTVTFQIEVTNNGPDAATNVSLIDSLPAGLTYTGDSSVGGAYDSTTGIWTIGTLASGATATLTIEGTVDAGQGGNTITNMTTAATGDQVDLSTVGDDLDESVMVTPVPTTLVPDISAAKQLVGTPNELPNGNFEVTYEVFVENTGDLELTSLTLTEDLAAQFGAAFVSASNLTLMTPTSDPASTITLNTANFNGSTSNEVIDQSTTSYLAAGDSFSFIFMAEINATAANGVLENQVNVSGAAVDGNRNPVTDAFGNQIVVSDASDSGATPGDNNVGEPGDTGSPDDPTPLYLPAIGLAKDVTSIVPNGTNFDVTFSLVWENTGNTILDHITLFDDVAGQFGSGFVGIVPGSLSVQNFSGTGVAPLANAAFEGDTTQNLLIEQGPIQVGDTFEVIFTTTVDPSGLSAPLENQATSSGEALDENFDHLLDSNGNFIVVDDASDSGTDPASENSSADTNDGVFANDPTQLVLPDLGLAKSLVGQPVLNDNGFYTATFQLVVENTGIVDLGSLSLLEDLASQFGNGYVNADNLTLVSGTSAAGSSVQLNSAFNGSNQTELLDQSISNTLAVGDSFTLQFDVDIDPTNVTDTLINQVSGTGNALDANGNEILDANGNPIMANDLSDSGTDPNAVNSGEPGDQGTPDDPTPFIPPAVPTSQVSGTVFQDNNNDGIQDAGEAGIAGVTVTLTGTDVYGNVVSLTTVTDANGSYLFDGLVAGTYSIVQTQPEGFVDGIDNSGFTVGNDSISNINLGFGQTVVAGTFAEQLAANPSGVAGNPPNLPRLGPIFNSPINNLLRGFTGAPGPIYSGIPINANADPLSLDSGRAVAGGYAVDGTAGDCCLPEPIDPCCEPTDPCGETINVNEEMIEQPVDCGCEGEIIETEQLMQTEGEAVPVANELTDGEQIERTDQAEIPSPLLTEATLGKTSLLKRMSNWLNI
jgi:uncharacterized repeat protein (TIGR01451 family)